MPQHVEGELSDVLREHVVTAVQEGERPGAGDQCDRGARAGPVADVPLQVGEPGAMSLASRGHQADGVVDDGGVDVDLPCPLLHADQVRRAEHRADLIGGAQRAVDDRVFLGGVRVADDDLHHEPIDLRLR